MASRYADKTLSKWQEKNISQNTFTGLQNPNKTLLLFADDQQLWL